MCFIWDLTRWPDAKAERRDSSAASTVAQTIRANCWAFRPGSFKHEPRTASNWKKIKKNQKIIQF